jgi:hypothetical protein
VAQVAPFQFRIPVFAATGYELKHRFGITAKGKGALQPEQAEGFQIGLFSGLIIARIVVGAGIADAEKAIQADLFQTGFGHLLLHGIQPLLQLVNPVAVIGHGR